MYAKRFLISATCAAALFGAGDARAAAASPNYPSDSYLLGCTAGGDMTWSLSNPAVGASLPATVLVVKFRKASMRMSAADPSLVLPAGTCAWLDRPLTAQEPSQMSINLAYPPLLIGAISYDGKAFHITTKESELTDPCQKEQARLLGYKLNPLVSGKGGFIVRVKNVGGQFMAYGLSDSCRWTVFP